MYISSLGIKNVCWCHLEQTFEEFEMFTFKSEQKHCWMPIPESKYKHTNWSEVHYFHMCQNINKLPQIFDPNRYFLKWFVGKKYHKIFYVIHEPGIKKIKNFGG